ncbi:MAG: hypothetical protein V3R20_00860 [Sphingomonadales bacterium]
MQTARTLLTLALCLLFPAIANAVEFEFADAEKAREILMAQDAYYYRMSPAEIAIRMESAIADRSIADLKGRYSDNVLDWTPEEIAQFQAVIDENHVSFERIQHLLPAVIYLIRATGKVEGGLPHTHANAIIIQTTVAELTADLLLHETFHVLSRSQAARHASLYGLLGFAECFLKENEQLQAIHLTNPDVPLLSYYLPVTFGDAQGAIIPFLYAARAAFDPEIEGGFPGHFAFGLLQVKAVDSVCTIVPGGAGEAKLLNPENVPEFFTAIGRNTGYIIHPEEVLADNFVFLLTGRDGLPNPEIVERLGQWIDDLK